MEKAPKDWEIVRDNVMRLEVGDGHLYRIADGHIDQVVFVPDATIGQSLYDLAQTLTEIKDLISNATFSVSEHTEAVAIRTSNIGE
jgi:hypothetical protein